jgi:Ni/Co efflux regulator RcnB
MKPHAYLSRTLLGLAITLFAAAPALAERPDRAGGGPGGGKYEQRDKGRGDSYQERGGREARGDDRRYRDERDGRDGRAPSVSVNFHFGDAHRAAARDYYRSEFSRGACPPGLAKKNNGCMPPGQAKQWSKGRPLPRDVVYYDLPPALVIKLGTPPAGHRFVRVAADILLIAVGTGMVIDAIEDLSRL